MRKAPELYFFSFLVLTVLIRWYYLMLEARNNSMSRSFPEDPDFIREKEELNRRASNRNRNRIRVRDNECK